MGTTYYADFDATGGGNAGTEANPWESMAHVIAGTNSSAPAAGDTVLCKGTDSTSAVVTWNISGSAADGFIKLIGVDASWANVGGSTRAVINRGGGNSIVLLMSANFVWLENFEITGGGSSGTNYHGVQTPSGGYRNRNVFVNCYSHHNYGEGFDGAGGYGRLSSFFKCRSSNNALTGWADWKNSLFAFCRADANTSYGFYPNTLNAIYGCIAHDNTVDGIYNFYGAFVFNTVLHGNGGNTFAYPYVEYAHPFIGIRSTENTKGFSVVSTARIPLFGFYGDNTTETEGYYDEVLNDGVSTVILNGTDTDEGYVASASDNYNLATDASLRRLAVSIP